MKKYLRSLFETEDTKYKQEYLEIIQYYKDNPIKKYTADEIIKNPKLYSEIHHIIPRWYYKANNLQLNNNDENIVRLPFDKHIKVHLLLVKHFEKINDKLNYYKAIRACVALDISISCKKEITKEALDELLQIRIRDIEYQRQIALDVNSRETNPWRKYSKQQLQEILDAYEKQDFSNIFEKYPVLKSEKYVYLFLKRRGFNPTKRTYNRAYSIDELVEFAKLYSQYGFQYVKDNTRYRGNIDSFLYILDRNNIEYPGKILHHRKNKRHKKIENKIPDDILIAELEAYRKFGYDYVKEHFPNAPKYQTSFYITCKRRGLLK